MAWWWLYVCNSFAVPWSGELLKMKFIRIIHARFPSNKTAQNFVWFVSWALLCDRIILFLVSWMCVAMEFLGRGGIVEWLEWQGWIFHRARVRHDPLHLLTFSDILIKIWIVNANYSALLHSLNNLPALPQPCHITRAPTVQLERNTKRCENVITCIILLIFFQKYLKENRFRERLEARNVDVKGEAGEETRGNLIKKVMQ